jgi:hypothetical protein
MGGLGLAAMLSLLPQLPAGAETVYWTGASAGYTMTWSDGDIRVQRGAETVLSCRKELLALIADEPKAELDASLEPVSWVGPVLTVKISQYIHVPMTAHPSMVTYYRTVDLRRPGQPARLTDWVPPQAVLSVLQADLLVKKALKDLGGPTPKSVPALGERLSQWSGDCQYGFSPDFADHFAFYQLQGAKTTLRIGLSHGCEAARGMFTLLGVEMPVTPALQGHLQAAATGKAGFLAVNRPGLKRIKPARVHVTPPAAPLSTP